MDKPLWAWAGFLGLVLVLLFFDFRWLLRPDREITMRSSLRFTIYYAALSLCFAGVVYYFFGAHDARDYLTGYLVEASLSMDNIFAMSLVFAHFYIPRKFQRRVLVYGIFGVILLRGVMIALGATLIQHFTWTLYVFGAFLIFSGIRMLYFAETEDTDLENSRLLGWLRRHIPITSTLHENRFFAYERDPERPGQSVRRATPLFLVLVFIELADVVFAVDSVPAVFAITTDPFIVYTSNVFAILGLRAMYFTLAAMLHRFSYLKYALALVLMFIGAKIFLVPFIGNVPAMDSLVVTLTLLAGGVIVSLHRTRGHSK